MNGRCSSLWLVEFWSRVVQYNSPLCTHGCQPLAMWLGAEFFILIHFNLKFHRALVATILDSTFLESVHGSG